MKFFLCLAILLTAAVVEPRAASVEVDLNALDAPGTPKLRPPRGVKPAPATTLNQDAALPTPAPVAGPNADALFVLAFGLERAGRSIEAEARYQQIVAVFPHATAAPLAAERLEALRQAAAAALPPLIASVPSQDTPAMQTVCSQPGLYANRSRWCGQVVRAAGDQIEIELSDVRVTGFLVLGFKPGPCTGERWLDRRAVGARITVPASCVGEVW
ncbi:MAG: hypothetical protein FJX52_05585 [Alphaproteobacteria bacterium]|nr:hypothetical protein [Alphaproteobacteria bacterium]